jgi:leader peptidase (prepilin peptidase) / N-methyltransferase
VETLLSGQFYTFYLVVLGAFGLLFGSFANVLIWRVPRDESIVSPGSHCPSCGHPIRWHDNIPVVSWVVLRRKCRDCGEPIPWRYPVVELLSGALWVLAGWHWGFSTQTPLAIAFFYMLLVLSVVDIDTRRLPTALVAVIGVAGVVAVGASLLTGLQFGPLTGAGARGWFGNPAVVAIAGLVTGAGVGISIAAVYSWVRHRRGLGFGDIRLLGAIGLVLGPYVLLAYALANILGVFGAIPALVRARRDSTRPDAATSSGPDQRSGDEFWTKDDAPAASEFMEESSEVSSPGSEDEEPAPLSIPFGPFLGLAGIVTALWGPALWGAYLRVLGVG